MINALTAPNANPAIVTGITWVHHSGGSCPVPVTAHSVANPAIAAGSPGQQTTVTRDPARSSGNVSARSTRRVRGEERLRTSQCPTHRARTTAEDAAVIANVASG